MAAARKSHRSTDEVPPPSASPSKGPPELLRPGDRIPLLAGAVLALTFVLIAVLAVRKVGSLDAGFQLKAGERILSGGGWPVTDPFTFTLRDHLYLDTSWGYQLLLALIWKGFQTPGLVLFHALLVLTTFFIIYRTVRLAPVGAASVSFLFLLGGLTAETRFEVRPELLSYLLLALVLHLLHRRAEGRSTCLWALPVIHLVWSNCHSLFVLGWVVLGGFAVGLAIREKKIDWELWGWSAASVVAAFVNPYGWRGVLFPFTLLTRLQAGNPFAMSIGEFLSPLALNLPQQFPSYPKIPIGSFRLLAALAVVALIPLLRKRRYPLVLLTLAFLFLAGKMIRNMPLLAVVAVPGVAWSLADFTWLRRVGVPERGRLWLRTAGLSAMAVGSVSLASLVIHDAYYIAGGRDARFGWGWNRWALPLDAAAYARRAPLEGPVLNHLNFGGTLIWTIPQPVFIDGRLEVVGEEFYSRYLWVMGSPEGLESAVAEYGIQWIVFPYAISPALLGRVSEDSRWRLTYVDSLAAIFVREGPGAAGRVDPSLAGRLAPPSVEPDLRSLPGLGKVPRRTPPRRWISALFRTERYPSEDFSLGLFHYFRGEMLPAEARFAAAIRESGGDYYEIYYNLGEVLFRRKRFAEARECYRIVLEEEPENRLAQERSALPVGGGAE